MHEIISTLRRKYYLIKWNIFKTRVIFKEGLRVEGRLDVKGKGKITIGENCTIAGTLDDENRYTTIYTDHEEATVEIGNNVTLVAARIVAKYRVHIGDDSIIEDASIYDTDFHSIDKGRGDPEGENREKCTIIIGKRVSIGSRSIIGKGVKIGDDTVVAPGSIVLRSVPSSSFVMGNPAKVVPLDK